MQLGLSGGMRSSEFWAGLLLPVIVILFGKHLGLDLKPEELYALVASGGLYGVSRGLAKKAEPAAPK